MALIALGVRMPEANRPSTDIQSGAPVRAASQHQYLAARDLLAAEIAAGRLAPGAKLPSERQMQMTGGLARGTIREALFQLEAEGMIYRRDRSGWYVSPPPIVYDPTQWTGFMAYVTAQGREPQTETLSKEVVPVQGMAAKALGLEPGQPVFLIRRRRSIDGRVVLVERITVDPALAPGLLEHSLDGSLTAVLRNVYGVDVERNVVDMFPCALIQAQAEALRVKSGTPGLAVVRTSFDALGRVVEFDEEAWRHDAVRIRVDLNVKMAAKSTEFAKSICS